MAQEFTVSLQAIIDECKLEVIHTPQDPAKIFISNIDVNRPGLQLAGFYEYFDKGRIQIIGKAETAYLEQCGAEIRAQRIKKFFSEQPAAVVVSRGMDIMPEMRDLSKELNVPLLRSEESTSTFTSKLVAYLSLQLAPRITRHGVLIEVYGEGMLILGESGVGKSETAIELVKRGHRLVADDAVEPHGIILRFLEKPFRVRRISRQHIALLEHKISKPDIALAVCDNRTDGDIDHTLILFFGNNLYKAFKISHLITVLCPLYLAHMTDPAGGKGAVLQIHIRDVYRPRAVIHKYSDRNLCDPAILWAYRAMHMSKTCHSVTPPYLRRI